MRDFGWKLPERKVYQQLGYMTEAVKNGQENAGKKVFLLEGGNEFNRREYAGALLYGCMRPEDWSLRNTAAVGKGSEETGQEEKDSLEKELEALENLKDLEDVFKEFKDEELEQAVKNEPDIMHLPENPGEDVLAEEIVLKIQYDYKEEREMYCGETESDLRDMHVSGRSGQRVYLLSGEITPSLEEQIFQFICECVEGEGKIIVIADAFSEKYIRKLQFQLEAVRLSVSVPKMKDYELVVRHELMNAEMNFDGKTEVKEIVCLLKSFLTDEFSMDSIRKAVERAAEYAKKDGRTTLMLDDFNYFGKGYRDPEEELERLIGLKTVKEKIHQMIAVNSFDMERQGPDFSHGNFHVAFAGNPGSGKSIAGKIYAGILTKYGITNGTFILACKNDYIGAYTGHTARKMRKLFRKARGGVIFFDEAGAFLTSDSFAEEARTELVRFMELYPDVICIFASYKDTIRQLLEMDAGIRSRIMEILTFEDYSDAELFEILCAFCEKEGYRLEEEAREVFEEYADHMREENPKSFGNGRLARNLFQKAKELLAVDVMKNEEDPLDVRVIDTKYIRAAAEEMTEHSLASEKNKVGFLSVG